MTAKEHLRLDDLYGEQCKELRGDKTVLLVLYEQMLSTLSERVPTKISASGETITISEVMEKIKQQLEKMRLCHLQQSFSEMRSRYELVAHIIAVLQMVRDNEINIYQEEVTGPIWLSHKDHADSLTKEMIAAASDTQEIPPETQTSLHEEGEQN